MRLKRFLDDESGQVFRYVLKFGIAAAVVIFLLAEVGPIIWMRVSLPTEAEEVASAVASDYRLHSDKTSAMSDGAGQMRLMGYTDEEIRESSIQFLPEGAPKATSVRVTVVKYAKTLVSRHIGFLRKLSRIAVTKEVPVMKATESFLPTGVASNR